MEAKYCKESRVIRTSRIFPNDVNNHNTLFGGRLMSDVDQVASISAARHSRSECATACRFSDLYIQLHNGFSLFYILCGMRGTSSMEVFVKIIAEDLKAVYGELQRLYINICCT
jgi:acyl-CoA hydrolase